MRAAGGGGGVFARSTRPFPFPFLPRVPGPAANGRDASGPAGSLLRAERVALNFLQRLSGVATATSLYASRIAAHGTKLLDTRKTTPLLRVLEKYAVRVGGGSNHRFSLSDGILIKENGIRAAGGIAPAVAAARSAAHHLLRVEVEAETLAAVGGGGGWADASSRHDPSMSGGRRALRRESSSGSGDHLGTVEGRPHGGGRRRRRCEITHSAPSFAISFELSDVKPCSVVLLRRPTCVLPPSASRAAEGYRLYASPPPRRAAARLLFESPPSVREGLLRRVRGDARDGEETLPSVMPGSPDPDTLARQ